MDNREVFAKHLRETRESLNMTQKEFAKHVESTAATISAYENATKNPSLDIVVNIASKCGVSIDWLCGLEKEANNNKPLETYAGIIRFLYKLSLSEKASTLCFRLIFPEENDLSQYMFPTLIKFDNKKMYDALSDFNKIYDLYKGDLIDADMYNVLINNLCNKYSSEFIPDAPF